jgi:hypothetical protein
MFRFHEDCERKTGATSWPTGSVLCLLVLGNPRSKNQDKNATYKEGYCTGIVVVKTDPTRSKIVEQGTIKSHFLSEAFTTAFVLLRDSGQDSLIQTYRVSVKTVRVGCG